MYHFIVNPNARSGMGHKVWGELETILRRENIEYEVYFTQYQKQATQIAKDITSDGEEHILVGLGGDGTVNEIINGIAYPERSIFGYIPIGSGNDFARGLKLPTKPEEALRLILEAPHLRSVNIGEIRYKNKSRRFAVSAGVGFDADIVHESVVSHLKTFLNKIKLGKMTYVGVAIHRLFLTDPSTVKITLDDGEEMVFPRTYFVALMNNPYEGGGVKFAPQAENDDDMLDVVVIAGISKLKALMMFPAAMVGTHTRFTGVHIFKASHISIHAENPLPVHTDGEPIFLQKQVVGTCVDTKLRVITRKPE